MSYRSDPQTAIVTGGGHGTGTEIAQQLASNGLRICIADLNPDRADAAAAAVVQQGGAAIGIQVDVSNKFQAAAMIEAARDAFQTLDVLVCGAHVTPNEDILTMDEWQWRRTVEVNLTGAFFCAQLAARVMQDEGGGHIYLLSQENSTHPAMHATQAAVRGLAAGLDAALSQVQVVALTPQKLLTHLRTKETE